MVACYAKIPSQRLRIAAYVNGYMLQTENYAYDGGDRLALAKDRAVDRVIVADEQGWVRPTQSSRAGARSVAPDSHRRFERCIGGDGRPLQL